MDRNPYGRIFRRGEVEVWTDTMQVCLNGHKITGTAISIPDSAKKHCPDCGEETILACTSCKHAIPGYQHSSVIYPDIALPPKHCDSCGEPFPWTEKIMAKKAEDSKTQKVMNDRVFIVHGHDDAMKLAVARTVERLGLKSIILHEQPNKGRTIIEKFEDESEVGFAVVLLSPDDKGYAVSAGEGAAKFRARQNVVAELFYFMGKLGRSLVMPLVKGDIEQPSDIAGIVYETFDGAEGGWRLKLVAELNAAGYDVSADNLTK